jgi:hypothetical protein
MTYDLRWVDPPTPDDPPYEGRFTMGINMMGMTRIMMLVIGIVEPAEEPALPALSEFGLDEDPSWYDENGQAIEYPLTSGEGLYQRVREAVKTSDSGGLIPTFKLLWQDGCVVTPEEIERSLAAHDAIKPMTPTPRSVTVPIPDEDVRTVLGRGSVEIDWWGDWIAWLRGAAEHGGFTVN